MPYVNNWTAAEDVLYREVLIKILRKEKDRLIGGENVVSILGEKIWARVWDELRSLGIKRSINQCCEYVSLQIYFKPFNMMANSYPSGVRIQFSISFVMWKLIRPQYLDYVVVHHPDFQNMFDFAKSPIPSNMSKATGSRPVVAIPHKPEKHTIVVDSGSEPQLPQDSLKPRVASPTLHEPKDTRLKWSKAEDALLASMVTSNSDSLMKNNNIKDWIRIAETLKRTTGIERTVKACRVRYYRDVSKDKDSPIQFRKVRISLLFILLNMSLIFLPGQEPTKNSAPPLGDNGNDIDRPSKRTRIDDRGVGKQEQEDPPFSQESDQTVQSSMSDTDHQITLRHLNKTLNNAKDKVVECETKETRYKVSLQTIDSNLKEVELDLKSNRSDLLQVEDEITELGLRIKSLKKEQSKLQTQRQHIQTQEQECEAQKRQNQARASENRRELAKINSDIQSLGHTIKLLREK